MSSKFDDRLTLRQDIRLPPPTPAVLSDANKEAFEFVRELATELSRREIELPSFPDVAMRMQRALAEDSCNADRVVRLLGSESLLAARVLTIANSAALNPGGKRVENLRAAVARIGFDALRSAVVSFAMAQLGRAEAYKGIELHLNVHWQHSVVVASLSFVLARRVQKVSADTAMLTGLIHGVGKLYVLTHSIRHPVLFADQPVYQSIVRDWHANIAKALLETWRMPEEVVAAVHSYEDPERALHGAGALLADVLEVGVLLALCHGSQDLVSERLEGCRAAVRLALDAKSCGQLMAESSDELNALRQALGRQ